MWRSANIIALARAATAVLAAGCLVASIVLLVTRQVAAGQGTPRAVISAASVPQPRPQGSPAPQSPALIAAVRAKDTAKVSRLLAAGASPNAVDIEGSGSLPAVALAAQLRAGDVVRLLVAKGASVNAAGEFDETALVLAVRNRDTELVRFLLAQGANANIRTLFWGRQIDPSNMTRDTPITRAVENGDPATLAELLEGRADPNFRDADGKTALAFAVQADRADMAGALLAARADPNAADGVGITPLMLAKSAAVAQVLMDRGADVNAQDRASDTPLHYAAHQGATAVMAVLIAHGANVNAKGLHGATPVFPAATFGHTDALTLLLDRGANVNAMRLPGDYEDGTVLAAIADGSDTVYGNPGDARVQAGQAAMILLLLERGADPNLRAPKGLTPLMFAAGRSDNVQAMKALLDHRADVHAADAQGHDALMWAVALGKADAVQLLVDHGANLAARDSDGETPLIRAAHYANPDTVAYLLAHGANVEGRDNQGETALFAAIAAGDGGGFNPRNPATVKALLASRADVNVTDNAGQTPLMVAARMGSIDYVRLLLARGAHAAAHDKSGRTAHDYASQAEYPDRARKAAIVAALRNAARH